MHALSAPCVNAVHMCADPNYVGETIFWFSLAIFGVVAHQAWTLCGAVFNTLVLVQVTQLTEERMLRRESRRHDYEVYASKTPCWIPVPWKARRKTRRE